MSGPRRLSLASLIVALPLLLAAHRTGAQDTPMVATSGGRRAALDGRIFGERGQPVAYAAVFTAGGALLARADESGIFHLTGFPAGVQHFGVRRIGYAPVDFEIEMPPESTVTVVVRLKQVVQRLREITVEEKRVTMSLWRAGFYERQAEGLGTFLLPLEIDARHATQIADLLYGITSVSVNNGGSPYARFAMGMEAGRPCALHVWLDGHPMRLGAGGLTEIPVAGIRAAEIYPRASVTPIQFQGTDYRCGAIVLWTRVD